MATSFKMSSASLATLSALEPQQATTNPCLHQGLHRYSQASLGQSLGTLSRSLYALGFVCALKEPASLVLCRVLVAHFGKFNGSLLKRLIPPLGLTFEPLPMAGHC